MRASIVAVAIVSIASTAASAQVLQRRFDPQRNPPWTVVDLGTQDRDAVTHDPRAFAVGDGGAVHAVCKVPVEGPPTGGAVLRLDRGRAEPVGGPVGDDPAAILDAGGALHVAGKGFASQPARVLRLEGGAWVAAHDGALESEMRGLAFFDGAIHVATKSDGVYRLVERALERVGATTTVQPEGYAWSALGDYAADVHEGAFAPGGELVVVAKDQRVRRWNGEAWRDLGNLAEATWDPAGVPLTFVREPKGVTVAADGTIYVGTKGLEGSSEGRDRGAVWRWTGAEWQRLGTADLRKEAKRVIAVDGGVVFAGTSETGVFRWDGATWTAINDGLPADAGGKIKGERLFLGSDGRLYAAIANAVHRRGTGAAGAWTEVGFFPAGEEVTFAGVALGKLHVGCKVGASAGAVYVQELEGWSQLGADLPRDVKQLAWSPGGELHAVMGAGAGTVRWRAGAWTSVLGNLTGDASDFKQLVIPTDAELFGISKLGVQRGAYQREPIAIVDFALKNRAVTALAGAGGRLWAITETDGVFRRVTSETSDDGLDWRAGAAGLPDVELRGMVELGERTFVLGKHLLYEGRVEADGTLTVQAFGTNPGKAALDGNGNLIFTGETEFTALAVHGDRLFVGTKDGLFVTREGRVWELYNGPAEVKALAIVGDLLYAAVKSKEVLDVAQPTSEVHAAQVWIRDLRVAGDDDGEGDPGGGCSTSGRGASGAVSVVLALGVLMLWPFRRREAAAPAKTKKPNHRLLGWSRRLHTWSGVALGLVIFVEGCTGLYLLHHDDVKSLGEVRVPSALLPARYDRRAQKPRRAEQVVADPADPRRLLAANRDAVARSIDGGATWTAVGARAGFDQIHDVAFAAGAIWVGHHDGLAVCEGDGLACRAVPIGAGDHEVRAVVARGDEVVIGVHRRGVLASVDRGASWRVLSEGLWAEPRARDEKGEVHVHGVAVAGEALHVATSAGLFRSDASGAWRLAGLAGAELHDVVIGADGGLWVAETERRERWLVSRDGGIAWDAATPSEVPGGAALATVPVLTAATTGERGAPLGKVLDDLHTGKFFGGALWIVYDLAALAMMLFVITGFHLWVMPFVVKRRKRARAGAGTMVP